MSPMIPGKEPVISTISLWLRLLSCTAVWLVFLACTAHVVDVGGRGFGADANSVYEEGIHIPIMKFADRGEVNATLVSLLRSNVREPDQVVGDFFALATCNEVGHRRLSDMMEEFGLSGLKDVAAFILDNSRRATLECINALPTGRPVVE